MKKHRKLNFFIGTVTLLILSIGILDSPVFADGGCTTTTWGTQTADWRQMFLYHNPWCTVCGCVIGYCWGFFDHYDDSTGGSLGPIAADEIVVGGLTQVCESPGYCIVPGGDCYTGPSGYYPSVVTTIAIYLDKRPMG